MRRIALCILCVFVFLPVAWAQHLIDTTEELVLDNGMRFLLHNRGEAPVFSGVIRWDVGSADDPPGETGIAHMFEHMAFKGTTTIGTIDWEAERPILDAINRTGADLTRARRESGGQQTPEVASLEAEYQHLVEQERRYVVKDELDDIYTAAGASDLNASTSRDFTTYRVSLPSNALELWCLLESARIRDAVLREFYSERDVVFEERRMRTDTDPEGKLVEDFLATAYIAHPYGRATIGWASDISNLTTEDARAFYHAHYAPVNACAALVGQFDMEEAKRLIRRYFSPIPPGERSPRITTVEPEQHGQRRVDIFWDAQPVLLIGYHKPNPPSHTDAVFDVIHALLTRGRTSRLYDRMVKREQLVTDIEAFSFPDDKYPNLSAFYAVPRAPHTVEEVETVIYEELNRLASEPVTDHELQRVKNNLDADFLRNMQSNLGLSLTLTYWQFTGGDWRWAERWRHELDSVTPEEIMQTAARYYTPENRTVGTIVTTAPAPPVSVEQVSPETTAVVGG